MPSLTITVTDEVYAEFVEAFDHHMEREPEDETDAELVKRGFRGLATDFLHAHRQRKAATEAAVPDIGIE